MPRIGEIHYIEVEIAENDERSAVIDHCKTNSCHMMRNDFACLNVFLFYFVFVLPMRASAQSDTAALNKAILVYRHSKAAEASLYSGVLYAGYNLRLLGHPFYQSDSPIQGSLTYDGTFFPDVPLSYDLEKDLVVIPDKHNILKIQLISEKLLYFTIGDHRFIHLRPNNSEVNAPAEGFYEVLYEGKDRKSVV